MKKTKISILLPVWQRAEILEIVLRQLEIFTKHKDFDFLVFFIYSDEDPEKEQILKAIENSTLNKKAVQYSNAMLGAKMNAGILEIMKTKFDYLMNLGSDDLISPAILELYKPYIKKADLIGLNSCIFFGSEKEILQFERYNQKSIVGAGRLISKKAIETVLKNKDTVYSTDFQRGLDSDSNTKLNNYGIFETVIETNEPLIVDIKSDVNINEFWQLKERFDFKKVEFQELSKYFDSEILAQISGGFIGIKPENLKIEKQIKCFCEHTKQIRFYNRNIETERAIQIGLLKIIE